MSENTSDIHNYYQSRLEDLAVELNNLKSKSSRYSIYRLSILIGLISWVYFMLNFGPMVLTIGIIVLIVTFVIIVSRQTDVDNSIKLVEHKILICQNELDTLSQQSNLYYNGEKYHSESHINTSDLDVFGPSSLYGWINRAKTYRGLLLLSDWFSITPSMDDINGRREAIIELEKLTEWRIDFQSSLFKVENGVTTDISKILKHELDSDLSFSKNIVITYYIKFLPILWSILAVLYYQNVEIASSLAGGLFIVNLLIVGRYNKIITEIQNRLSKASAILSRISAGLDRILQQKWQSKLLYHRLKNHQNQTSTANSILHLNQIIAALDYRMNLLVGVTLNGLLLWDLKIVGRLCDWKESEEEDLYDLIDIVGLFEALTSLANWAYNHPDYHYPTISNDRMDLKANEINHPLILKSESVANDFKIEKGDYIAIITGSNMAGKSTFLRTLGSNMVLAYTGTKVAAQNFECPLIKVVTYMRIKDVLEDNVSTFKAELNRIKLILDLIKEDDKVIVLIDEMLRGTNSKDKLQGSISITKKLLENQAYTIIATHDIKLAELATEINNGIKNYYFDIDYANDELVFDYKIKQGICQNFNASFLLKQLGIGV